MMGGRSGLLFPVSSLRISIDCFEDKLLHFCAPANSDHGERLNSFTDTNSGPEDSRSVRLVFYLSAAPPILQRYGKALEEPNNKNRTMIA